MGTDLDKDYAERKLIVLLRDLNNYDAGEFWREMSRIASGATGSDHAEQLHQRVAELQAECFADKMSSVKFESNPNLNETITTIPTKELEAIKKERDALAAHNQSLKGIILKLLDRWWPFVHGSVAPSDTTKGLLKTAGDVINESPQTSLAEVKAVQAEKSFKAGFRSYRVFVDSYGVIDVDMLAHDHVEDVRKRSTAI